MIGNNEIRFCPAEMNRAVEQYLRSIFSKEYGDRLKVVSIRQEGDGSYSEGFTVKLEGQTIPECPSKDRKGGQ